LVNLLECQFFEPYEERVQPVTLGHDRSARQYAHGCLKPTTATSMNGSGASPVSRYPWESTKAALNAVAPDPVGSEVDGILFEYANPLTGGSVMPTMSCRIQQLP